MTNETPLLYTTKDVARLLSVSEGTVKNLVGCGQIASVKIRNSRRVPAKAVQDYIERLENEALAQAS